MDGYWQKRIEAAAARQDKAIAKALPELLSNMQEARRSLEKEINAFYTRYATNNKISLAEAQKSLSLNELADFKGDLKTFKKLAKNSIGTFNLEVENLSVKARVTRLEALLAQCDGVLQNCYQQQRSLIEDTAAELAQEQYLHALYNIEQYSGFQFPFSQLSSARIAKMLAMPVNGADISTALWRQDIDTGFQIRRVLSNMFTTGRPPQDFAKELQRIIGRRDAEGNLSGKTYEAYRLLYNESAHISEQANLQALRDDGIEQYEVSATLDTHTCGVCQQQDGKVYETAKGVEGVNMPPFHVNCRCTIVPYIAEAKGSYIPTRAARDENGKTISTKAQTYEEWKKAKDDESESQFGVIYGEGAINVDMDYIKSKQYKEKFLRLTDNETVNTALYNTVREILEHCDGSEHEDMYLINAIDGSIFASVTDTARKSGIRYTDEFIEKLAESKEKGIPVIGIHNHPQGTPPSPDDFRKAYDNGYVFGIIPGHNGQLYRYETPKEAIDKELSAAMDRDIGIFIEGGTDVDRAFEMVYNASGLIYTIIGGR